MESLNKRARYYIQNNVPLTDAKVIIGILGDEIDEFLTELFKVEPEKFNMFFDVLEFSDTSLVDAFLRNYLDFEIEVDEFLHKFLKKYTKLIKDYYEL